MSAEPVHHVLAAMHDVEHTGRNARLDRQLHQEHGRHRVLFGRLEHEGVAAGDGHREHPQRNHRREVERGNAGAHADWLAQGVGIDATGDVFSELAHLQAADGAGVLDHFQATENIAFGVGNGLALLGAQDRGDALGVFANQRLELEHDAHPRADGRQLPGLEGAMGRTDGRVDFFGGGKRHFGQHLLGRRVDDVVPFGGLGFDPLAVDQQFDLLHGGVIGRERYVHVGLRMLVFILGAKARKSP
ncbi:hypothetical protein D3C87_1197960 [compost metagenome]